MQESINYQDGDLVAFEAKVCCFSSMVEEMKSAEPIVATRSWMTYLNFQECNRIKFVKGFQGFWTDETKSTIAIVGTMPEKKKSRGFFLIPFSEEDKLWYGVEKMILSGAIEPSGYYLHELQRNGVTIKLPKH